MSSEMIDSLAHVNVAILRNLLGGGGAAAMGAPGGLGVGGGGDTSAGKAVNGGTERHVFDHGYTGVNGQTPSYVHHGETPHDHRGIKRKYSQEGDGGDVEVDGHDGGRSYSHDRDPSNRHGDPTTSVSLSMDENYHHLGIRRMRRSGCTRVVVVRNRDRKRDTSRTGIKTRIRIESRIRIKNTTTITTTTTSKNKNKSRTKSTARNYPKKTKPPSEKKRTGWPPWRAGRKRER